MRARQESLHDAASGRAGARAPLRCVHGSSGSEFPTRCLLSKSAVSAAAHG